MRAAAVLSEAEMLRHRLNNPMADIERAAQEAAFLFGRAEMEPQVTWLGLELRGYGYASAAAVHQALGVAFGDRLATHVAAYRSMVGRIVVEGIATSPVRHFFVESVGELIVAAARVREHVTGELQLDFGADPANPAYPLSALFDHDVFDRVLLGFRATLHLQLASLLR